jgi:hypothetical protein
MFPSSQTGAIHKMTLYSFIEPFQHLSLAMDDGTLGLLSLLVGMIGGWRISGWREKRARVRIDGKSDSPRHKE